jgi:hypothetical protein
MFNMYRRHVSPPSFPLEPFLMTQLHQSSATAALELHGRELEEGHPMNVFISNPERKRERTDANANDRGIYVAGLSKFTTKEDLENLFKSVSFPSRWIIVRSTILSSMAL